MDYSCLFLDSDVILDLILKRNPFYLYMQELLFQCKNKNLQINTSALAIADMNYILAREIGASEARKKLKDIIRIINVLSFEGEIVELAIDGRFKDLEDGFQNFIALKNNCDAIITRNTKDYKQATISVLTPEQFLKTL